MKIFIARNPLFVSVMIFIFMIVPEMFELALFTAEFTVFESTEYYLALLVIGLYIAIKWIFILATVGWHTDEYYERKRLQFKK